MAEVAGAATRERDRLITWALGTFHAGALLVTITLLLHVTGGLAPLLSGLSTAVGLALFGALWGATVWSTHRTIIGTVGPGLATTVPTGRLLGRAVWRGGINGIVFLALAAVILVISVLLSGSEVLPFLILLQAAVGLVFAFVLGCLIGLVFAGIDLILFTTARTLLR
jgi:hypothetical protein